VLTRSVKQPSAQAPLVFVVLVQQVVQKNPQQIEIHVGLMELNVKMAANNAVFVRPCRTYRLGLACMCDTA